MTPPSPEANIATRNTHTNVLDPKNFQSYISAAWAARDQGDAAEVLRLLQEAKRHFPEPIYSGRLCLALQSAATDLASSSPQVGCALYAEYVDSVADEERSDWDTPIHMKFALILMELGDDERSTAAWALAQKGFECRAFYHEARCCVCAKIAIRLARGDVAAAEQIFAAEELNGYFGSSAASAMIDCIIRGVQNDDAALLETGQREEIVGYLEPEIADILRSLRTATPAGGESKGQDDHWLPDEAEADWPPYEGQRSGDEDQDSLPDFTDCPEGQWHPVDEISPQ
jgi:hypothetical protein